MGVSSWGIQCHFGPFKSNIPYPKGAVIGATHLQSPSGVAIDLEGRVLVADSEQHKVHVFNKDGTIAQSIGAKGREPGQFNGPRDVAVDRNGRIFVTDGGNHRVQVFNKDYSVYKVIGAVDATGKPMDGSDPGQLSNPKGLAINTAGHILVADSGNHRVQVFALDGHAAPGGAAPASSVVRCFGSRGSDVGQLAFPHGVCTDHGGRVLVADSANHRVQAFEPDGTPARCGIGSEGQGYGPGQLEWPTGVALDPHGRVAVADSGNHRVQVFDAEAGAVAQSLGCFGAGPGGLNNPGGLAADGAGRVLVADTFNRRVRVL